MSIVNTYPVFEADQVLTNKHLNDVVSYLEQQERLTRCKLLGSGIVCGLDISQTPDTISITKGCGLTSQGYLMLFCDHIGRNGYKYIIPFTKPPFPKDINLIIQCGPEADPGNIPFYSFNSERAFNLASSNNNGLFLLLTQAEFDSLGSPASAIALSQFQERDQYAVVLFLDANQLNLKNCDTNDCNDKGSVLDFEIKPLLVHKRLLNPNGRDGNSSKSPFRHIELRRYNVPVNNLNSSSDVLNAFANLLDKDLLERLANDLAFCYEAYGHLVGQSGGNPFGTLSELQADVQFILKNHPVLIQYYYDFVYDLIHALYEFRHRIFDITSECCGDEMRFPFHLTLGEATANTRGNSGMALRQYFIYSPLFDREGERAGEVRSLLMRMILMYQNFQITAKAFKQFKSPLPEEVKITPSQYGHHFLSERAIPYYYRPVHNGADTIPEDLFYYWNYDKTKRGNARFNLSYRATEYNQSDPIVHPLLYDIEWNNFFRVEGHIGKNINSAFANVKSIQQRMNLPFDVVALSADYIGALVRGEEPNCMIQDLESDYRVLISEFICRLHDAFCYVGKLGFIGSQRAFVGEMFMSRRPATETADAEAGLSDSLFSLADRSEHIVIDHPFISSLVSEFHAASNYVKGDTLSRLCAPQVNTYGKFYMDMMDNGGRFINPVSVNATTASSPLQHSLFEFVDTVETMFSHLMNNQLSAFNTNDFKPAYNRYEREVNAVSASILSLMKNVTGGAADALANNYLVDLFGKNIQMLLQTCIVERLEALRTEYQRRLAQFRLAKNFNYYFKKHGGIEHKAGVPRGGTFILVYHEERRGRFIDINSIYVNSDLSKLMMSNFKELLRPDVDLDVQESKTKMLAIATLYRDPGLYLRFKDVMRKYLDDCSDMPPDKKTRITSIIDSPPEPLNFELTNGMVIADFYVPYLCCSDCPPIAYVMSENATVKMEKEYCRNDKGPYTIEVNPTGGTLQIDGKQAEPDKFTPSAFKVGSHAVTYTVNGKVVTTSFDIVAPPSVELAHKSGVGGKTVIVFSIKTNARPGSVYELDYGDGSSGKTTDPTDPAFAQHKYAVTQERLKFDVALIVTDGPCKGNAKDNVKFG